MPMLTGCTGEKPKCLENEIAIKQKVWALFSLYSLPSSQQICKILTLIQGLFYNLIPVDLILMPIQRKEGCGGGVWVEHC